MKNENEETNKKTNKKAIAIIIIAVVMVVATLATIGIVFTIKYFDNTETTEKSSKTKNEITKNEDSQSGTKTLMIYMCGSDLESGGGIATSNLQDLVSSKIDYENINIILCAGGSNKWYNKNISTTETSYFKVTNKGLETIKKQSKQDMASSTTLTNFIDYTYDNYKSDEYYLMFWDHGCALVGLEVDELSENILSLKDLNAGLKNSKLKLLL